MQFWAIILFFYFSFLGRIFAIEIEDSSPRESLPFVFFHFIGVGAGAGAGAGAALALALAGGGS